MESSITTGSPWLIIILALAVFILVLGWKTIKYYIEKVRTKLRETWRRE